MCVSYAFFYLHFSLLVFFSPAVAGTVLRGVPTTVDMGARAIWQNRFRSIQPRRNSENCRTVKSEKQMFYRTRAEYVRHKSSFLCFFFPVNMCGGFFFFSKRILRIVRETLRFVTCRPFTGDVAKRHCKACASLRTTHYLYHAAEDIRMKNVKIPMVSRTDGGFSALRLSKTGIVFVANSRLNAERRRVFE